MFLKEFNLNKKDACILIGIAIFSLILTAYYIQFNKNLGIYCSDVYIYLLNALYFTGHNINSTRTIYLSPVICYLTSLLFDVGIKDSVAIYIITGLFAIIGNIGFYILLRTRFNELLSLCGVILYATFAINLTWLANGSLDIPAVSITIWTVLLTVTAIDKHPKYYIAALPLFAIGFFTRYTVALIIPVLILYYLYQKGLKIEKNELKYILIGVLLTAAITFLIMHPILDMGDGAFAANSQISDGISGNQGSSIDPAYNTDVEYYLFNFLNFISASKISFMNKTPALENPTALSYIIIGILAIGSAIFISDNDYKLSKKEILPIALFAIAILTYTHITSFITILLVLAGLFLIGKDSENKMGLAMLSWILVNLIFYSYYSIKVNRYIIPAIPPLIYLTLSGIELIHEKININENIIPIILIALFIIQGFALCTAFEKTDMFIAPQEISEYIISEIPDYESKLIGVYNMRPYHWYLGDNVTGIESGNHTKIDESNVTYYISNVKIDDLNNYSEIKDIDKLYLYEKKSV